MRASIDQSLVLVMSIGSKVNGSGVAASAMGSPAR
jgi:hypothetical protein